MSPRGTWVFPCDPACLTSRDTSRGRENVPDWRPRELTANEGNGSKEEKEGCRTKEWKFITPQWNKGLQKKGVEQKM